MAENAAVELIPEEVIRSVVLTADAEVVAQFREHFGDEIDVAIHVLADTYRAFQRQQSAIAPDERSAIVQMFIHAALNSVITSLHHLVHGYPIASAAKWRRCRRDPLSTMIL